MYLLNWRDSGMDTCKCTKTKLESARAYYCFMFNRYHSIKVVVRLAIVKFERNGKAEGVKIDNVLGHGCMICYISKF